MSSYFPDDLYQALITVDEECQRKQKENDEFLTLVLPFKDFVLTSAGLVRDSQRILDGGIKIESLGITIMDGKGGSFQSSCEQQIRMKMMKLKRHSNNNRD